jgi:metal-responsive CopG/Arc/MetJ family transcriptional regulator
MGAISYYPNVKTIAITIDEDTLSLIDGLLAARSGPWKSRSQLVREALHEFVLEAERRRQEVHEAAVFREHRDRLAAQARALISEQAEP